MVKVSVIVPVYNVEQYLKECMDSLVGQTLKEIEIICVNDGSEDGSLEILHKYEREDKRIKVFSQQNQGASCARNHGVQQAVGEYLYFMDSDDILGQNALERLYTCAAENALDILYFDGESFFETEELKEKKKNYITYYIRTGDYSGVTTGPDLFRRMVMADEYRVSPCLQILRREFCLENKLEFYEGIVGEDNIFTCKSILMAKRVSHIKDRLFRRRVREDSVMTKSTVFENVYGYFVGFMEIDKTFCNNTLNPPEKEALAKVLDLRLKMTRKMYHELDEEQKKQFDAMNFREKIFFQLTVKEYDDVLCEQEELKEKYKQVCQDKTERGIEIHELRREKQERGIEIHELRREKQERGKQIQELKKEIANQKKIISDQNQIIQQQTQKITALEKNTLYRVGKFATKPFRR